MKDSKTEVSDGTFGRLRIPARMIPLNRALRSLRKLRKTNSCRSERHGLQYVTPVDGGNASEMAAKSTINTQTSVRVDPSDITAKTTEIP